MKKVALISISVILIASSCKKSDNTNTQPPVDNGPLGGTYTFKSSVTIENDTIIELGQFGAPSFEIATERTYSSTSCSGKITITKTNIKSEGLIWNYLNTTTGTKKNLTTNAITNLTYLSGNDTRGASGTSYNSNYTFSIAGSQMNLVDGQYIFNPAFQTQPSDKNYNYTFLTTDLTVTYSHYSSSNRSRKRTTSVFTKN